MQAQRRFRERQKTKFTELTGKVEELEGRLEELLSEKARLEDRTSILQRTLEMRRAGGVEPDEAAVSRLDSVVRSTRRCLACASAGRCTACILLGSSSPLACTAFCAAQQSHSSVLQQGARLSVSVMQGVTYKWCCVLDGCSQMTA